MLQGPVGSGKSFSLVLLAKRYVEQGNKVLYIDYRDIGAVDELLKLDESTLKHIEYAAPHEYEDLLKLKWPDDLGLIIFDAMHHLRFRSRKYIVKHYLEQGHYTVNGKEKEIEDSETFDLGTLGGYGTGYGAASLREDDVIERILKAPCDVAISAIPDKPKEDSDTFTEILTGHFDNILNLSFQDTDDGIRKWYYTLYRWRGIETNDYSPQENKGETDPFAVIEATGGKPMVEYMVRFTLEGESKKEFITAISAEEAEATLKAMYDKAEDIEVIE
jgi:hypothetical protein